MTLRKSYVGKVLDWFDLRKSKVPLVNQFKLSLDWSPKRDAKAEYMSNIPSCNGVGCLMYAMVWTRSDLEHDIS
jgi:hypothetical protein